MSRPITTSRETANRLHKMYEQGFSLKQIEDKEGIDSSTIGYAFHRYGLKLRGKKEATQLAFDQGRVRRVRKKGPDAYNWKGGRRITRSGYIELRLPEHPRARKSGYVYEHLVMWMEHHGEIPEGWHVHHLNGDKADNRIENLEAMSSKRHFLVLRRKNQRIQALEDTVSKLQEKARRLEKENEDLCRGKLLSLLRRAYFIGLDKANRG